MDLIATTVTKESEALPGVTYTVRRLNYLQRAARESAIVEHRDLIASKWQRFSELRKKQRTEQRDGQAVEVDDCTPAEDRERRILDQEIAALHSIHIKPAVIRAGLVKIKGLTLEGKPVATADAILECGPDVDALLDEIWAQCEVAGGLDVVTIKNSQSPGTSTEVGQADSQATTAASADETATTETASA